MAERRRWPFTRGHILIVLLLTVPRCSCTSCNNSDSGCNNSDSESCGPSFGGGGCGDFGESGCPDVIPAGTHTINGTGSFGTCTLECEPGWSDCDKSSNNGCETAGACPVPFKDASVPKPELLTALSGTPRGLAKCDVNLLYVFDDTLLDVIDTSTTATVKTVLTSSGTPTGGLACDGANVYWSTSSDADASTPNGSVWSLPFTLTTATAIATNVDPGRGIDVRAPRVYWIARTGFAPPDVGSMLVFTTDDAGTLASMPAVESDAYKAFALAFDGDYSLAHGALWFNSLAADASGPAATTFDASSASALFAGAGGAFAIVHESPPPVADASSDALDDATSDATDAGDPNDASDDVSEASDDASDDATDASFIDAATTTQDSLVQLTGSIATIDTGFGRIVATTGNGTALIASDDTLYFVDLPSATTTVLASAQLHITDLAMDGVYAYWTTRGQGTVPPAVWRIVLP